MTMMSNENESEPNPSDESDALTYDCKTIRTHEPEWGRNVYVMVTRFNGEDHTLGEMGFAGTYFQFSVMSQSESFRLTRLGAFEIKRDHPVEWFPDTNAYRLIRGLDSGSVDWTDLSDEDHLSPEDVDELTERGDGDSEELETDPSGQPTGKKYRVEAEVSDKDYADILKRMIEETAGCSLTAIDEQMGDGDE